MHIVFRKSIFIVLNKLLNSLILTIKLQNKKLKSNVIIQISLS